MADLSEKGIIFFFLGLADFATSNFINRIFKAVVEGV